MSFSMVKFFLLVRAQTVFDSNTFRVAILAVRELAEAVISDSEPFRVIFRGVVVVGENLTPTERKFLAVLGDGMAHRREELHACLPDTLGPLSNIWPHLTRLRKKVRPLGQEIVCEIQRGKICYRCVKLLCMVGTCSG
jgi:hypothetical protein